MWLLYCIKKLMCWYCIKSHSKIPFGKKSLVVPNTEVVRPLIVNFTIVHNHVNFVICYIIIPPI